MFWRLYKPYGLNVSDMACFDRSALARSYASSNTGVLHTPRLLMVPIDGPICDNLQYVFSLRMEDLNENFSTGNQYHFL